MARAHLAGNSERTFGACRQQKQARLFDRPPCYRGLPHSAKSRLRRRLPSREAEWSERVAAALRAAFHSLGNMGVTALRHLLIAVTMVAGRDFTEDSHFWSKRRPARETAGVLSRNCSLLRG